MIRSLVLILIFGAALWAMPPQGKKKVSENSKMTDATFSGLTFRGIGPAIASGRIGDFAVDPQQPHRYYAAVASGGVWKTINSGTTWEPVFDGQGSYSIGCITLDPANPEVVWVGTGENNSQRSVGYGDGVYRSLDGGKTWKHMGLKTSEHIGMIRIDPRNSAVIYVASQGPLWSNGGERGLYKSTDGGESWQRILYVDEYTGVSEVHFDPRDPDVLYASAYQRRRHVWTLINGGPGSAIYKSSDAGATWRKLETGLPAGKMGRIGMAVSPADPDIVYAIVEAQEKLGGFFRSTDRGESWEKRSGYVSGSPQYYQELFCDPRDPERVYSMDTWMMVTEDGGQNFRQVGERYKHVDNHALWIDPHNTDYLLAGCDGGVYESFDRGATWAFKANLPITQFYKVSVDNDAPFYNIYGGTQDNNTLGGPSRTHTNNGITNREWFFTLGGDGFETQIDPEDPNILYSQYQYGGLNRYDKRSGELIDIRPQPGKGEPALRWNWDAALIISPHLHTRLYYGANILFRSDDRGDTWRAVSPDLTRQLDRNKLPVMDKVWPIEAVAKNKSTSYYGNIVALSESPLQEGLLYVGTDDGLVQISEDGGGTWRKVERIPGVPEMSYVNCLLASQHDVNTVYAAFNNHKKGDFRPYCFKSSDRGRSWQPISANLPERGSAYAIAEDHGQAGLLFAGTEFGVFFSINDGKQWVQLKGGLPTIAVRDIAIQTRENDLVLGTFGRGFYVLDDYSPLRQVSEASLKQEATLFPIKKAWMYIESTPLSLPGKAFLGDDFYTAPNPPFGAVFTYYLSEAYKTRKAQRQEKQAEIDKAGGNHSYPTWEALREEMREEDPAMILTVRDEEGHVVRRLSGPATAGFHRIAWDLRYAAADPTSLAPVDESNPFASQPLGPMAMPGSYTVSLEKRVDGVVTPLAEPQTFSAEPLGFATLAAEDKAALLAFQKKTARLQRAVMAADRVAGDAQTRIDLIQKALMDTPGADPALAEEARRLENRLKDLLITLSGDPVPSRYSEPSAPGIDSRVFNIVYGHWASTSAPTATHQRDYDIAAEEFAELLPKLRTLVETDLRRIENELEKAGAPWTPGRFPEWERE